VSRPFTPHPYQHDIVDWIASHQRCGVFAGMGTGKTVSTLTALEALNCVADPYPALVLAPLRVARSTWPDELPKWDHTAHLGLVPITGGYSNRVKAARQHADLFSVNYDNLDWLVNFYGDNWPFKTVVADELTRLKSFRIRQGGKRSGALGKVAFSKVERFIGLTGTPTPNGLKDLWGQMWFIDQGARLGRTYSAFEQRWFRKGWDGFSLQPMAHAQAEIQALISDVCLTVSGLPVDEPIENIVYVDLPLGVRKMYNEMERDFFATIEREGADEIEVEASNAAVKAGKLLQLANGAIYHGDSREWEEVHREKLFALDSVVAEAGGGNVLVSYQFKHDVPRVQKHFPKAVLLGDDPATLRKWNAGELPMLLAHPASAGHGLNMQDGGNILADFGVGWNLENDMQIIERIGPQRQKQAGYDRPVFRHRIVARDTIEDVVLDRLQSKRTLQEVLLEALKKRKA